MFSIKKTIEHINLQLFLENILPSGEAFLEKHFDEIGRIADVFWQKHLIVFEIQCSPISLNEVQQRFKDYEKLGLCLVWILHAGRFNKKKVGHAEYFLRQMPCYFARVSSSSKAYIYDQKECFYGAQRIWRGPELPVDLLRPVFSNKTGWKIHFFGDRVHCASNPVQANGVVGLVKNRLERFGRAILQFFYALMVDL